MTSLDLALPQLGMRMLDASFLHPITAERRTEAVSSHAEADDAHAERPLGAYCMHHFVSSWVNHSSTVHQDTERRRQEGHGLAAMEGAGQPVLLHNSW